MSALKLLISAQLSALVCRQSNVDAAREGIFPLASSERVSSRGCPRGGIWDAGETNRLPASDGASEPTRLWTISSTLKAALY